MIKILGSTLGLLLLPIWLLACDVCGNSASTVGMGYVSGLRYNLLSLSWEQTCFQNHDLSDRFTTLRVSGQVHISPSFRLFISQGYAFNQRKHLASTFKMDGMTDLQVGSFFKIWENKRVFKTVLLDFDAGISVHIPTGTHDDYIVSNRNVPENFNPGRKNWGTQFTQILRLKHFKNGLMLMGNQTFFHATNKYRFGNQFSLEAMFSRDIYLKKHLIIPFVGIYGEHIGLDEYSDGQEVRQSGGEGLLGSAGFNLKMGKKLVVGSQYRFPMYSSYTEASSQNQGQWLAHITYLF